MSPSAMATGLLYDARFLEHDAGHHHPERRERLERAIAHLEHLPWYASLAPIAANTADRAAVEAVHSHAYLERAAEACRRGAPYLDVPDVGISHASFDVALLAAGGAIALGDAVVAGRIANGFALSRPPGHHAEHDLALGFCLFNNVAILARHLQRMHGVDKILVLDWDVHHGNGTQHTFEEDPSILYVSTHQYPYYPGTGAHYETGTGRGDGATLNCPMPAGAGDAEYEAAFRERILPCIEAFAPQFVILSAGFDAHAEDPLAGIELSTGFYRWMSERMMEIADKHADGRLVSMLEGGYNTRVLPLCIEEHLAVLAGVRAG